MSLEIDIKEVYLMATYMYALPVACTVPRPLSSQYVFDHITLLTKQLDAGTTNLNSQFDTIPVNATRHRGLNYAAGKCVAGADEKQIRWQVRVVRKT